MSKVIAVSGMQFEAECAKLPNVVNVLSGGDPKSLAQRLAGVDLKDVAAVISFGVAGGLNPSVGTGAVVVSDDVNNGTQFFSNKTDLSVEALALLRGLRLPVTFGQYYSDGKEYYSSTDKLVLFGKVGGLAVDLETGVAAQFADANKLPFLAVRAISDAADFSLPPLAYSAMKPDGTLDMKAVMKSIGGDLAQIPDLIKLGVNTGICVAHLKRASAIFRLFA